MHTHHLANCRHLLVLSHHLELHPKVVLTICVPVLQSFALWVKAKQAAKAAREEEGEEERKKKGGLTGREIFLEEGFVAEDDLGASGGW